MACMDFLAPFSRSFFDVLLVSHFCRFWCQLRSNLPLKLAPFWSQVAYQEPLKIQFKSHLVFHCFLIDFWSIFASSWSPPTLDFRRQYDTFEGFCSCGQVALGWPLGCHLEANLAPFWAPSWPQVGSKLLPKSIQQPITKKFNILDRFLIEF